MTTQSLGYHGTPMIKQQDCNIVYALFIIVYSAFICDWYFSTAS